MRGGGVKLFVMHTTSLLIMHFRYSNITIACNHIRIFKIPSYLMIFTIIYTERYFSKIIVNTCMQFHQSEYASRIVSESSKNGSSIMSGVSSKKYHIKEPYQQNINVLVYVPHNLRHEKYDLRTY